MVLNLNVTDEQKKLIESQGYMVVEFKLWYKKLSEHLEEAFQRVIDGLKGVILFLQDMILKVFCSFKEFTRRISEKYRSYIDDLKLGFDYEPRRKYPFVQSLGRKYQPNFSYKVIYHRCRDRC